MHSKDESIQVFHNRFWEVGTHFLEPPLELFEGGRFIMEVYDELGKGFVINS
jgi:hypothetical protein